MTGEERPGVLGGTPIFDAPLKLARPAVPDINEIAPQLERVLESGMLTNGERVRELEKRTADSLGVRECVAVSSCTSGLMLLLRASELGGEVVVPSFTFAATVHAVAWNHLIPVFADVDARALTLDPASVAAAIGPETRAILATHIYGTPCDIEGLQEVADANGLQLLFDAAHAYGSSYRGTPIGHFGRGEVFSLTPTKSVVAGEGGIIATNDPDLAQRCRIGRDYGNPGDYDCVFVGLSARLSEIHAILALTSLETLEERLERRRALAACYRREVDSIPGISFPVVPTDSVSTFKDLTILVDSTTFGCDAKALGLALEGDNVETRRYYAPPVDQMQAYADIGRRPVSLPVTESAARRVLSLPLLDEMTDHDIGRVRVAIERIHAFAKDVVASA